MSFLSLTDADREEMLATFDELHDRDDVRVRQPQPVALCAFGEPSQVAAAVEQVVDELPAFGLLLAATDQQAVKPPFELAPLRDDVRHPSLDGISLCLELRRNSDVPILFISARKDPPDRVVGLRIGADDYMAKPFDTEELVARVDALLRRSGMSKEAASARQLRFGRFVIDLGSVQAVAGDEQVQLTPTEFKLLRTLAGEPGRVFTRDDLLTGAQAGQMIKASLSRMYQEGRFLGGFEHTQDDLTYVDTSEGDPASFRGHEMIRREQELAYELVYHGGLIRD